MSAPSRFRTIAELLPDFRKKVLEKRFLPRFNTTDTKFPQLEIGPGMLDVLGGDTGHGKTTLALQVATNVSYNHPDITVLIANAEMSADMLLGRLLVRESGLSFDAIRDGELEGESLAAFHTGIDHLHAYSDRVAFLSPPFSTANLIDAAEQTGAGLVIVDYLQRFDPGTGASGKARVDAVMEHLRSVCMSGPGRAVLALAALSRISEGGDPTGIGRFRDSSEIEYGADAAYILTEGKGSKPHTLTLVKGRHGKKGTVHKLKFHAAWQTFEEEP